MFNRIQNAFPPFAHNGFHYFDMPFFPVIKYRKQVHNTTLIAIFSDLKAEENQINTIEISFESQKGWFCDVLSLAPQRPQASSRIR